MNRQVKKTKNNIANALLQTAKEKGIERVTIQDIIARADINRATFYYHYANKLELINEIETYILDGLIQTIRIKKIESIHSLKELLYQPILASLEHILEYSTIYTVLLSEQGITNFKWKILNALKTSIKLNMELLQKNKINFVHDLNYLTSFISGAQLVTIIDWVYADFETPPTILADYMSQLLLNGVQMNMD